jgi:hypothetical protein
MNIFLYMYYLLSIIYYVLSIIHYVLSIIYYLLCEYDRVYEQIFIKFIYK